MKNKLKIPILKNDDGLLDVVHKLITITGILFGAWTYFHTVHPIFTKENELLNAKGELLIVQKQINTLNNDRKILQKNLETLKMEVVAKEQQVAGLELTTNTLRKNIGILEEKTSTLQKSLVHERIEAARAHVMRLVDGISREAIDAKIGEAYGRTINFDLQGRCLQISSEGLASSLTNETEKRAFRVLSAFAHKNLKPEIHDYTGLFEIITFMITDENAIAMLRGEDE